MANSLFSSKGIYLRYTNSSQTTIAIPPQSNHTKKTTKKAEAPHAGAPLSNAIRVRQHTAPAKVRSEWLAHTSAGSSQQDLVSFNTISCGILH